MPKFETLTFLDFEILPIMLAKISKIDKKSTYFDFVFFVKSRNLAHDINLTKFQKLTENRLSQFSIFC